VEFLGAEFTRGVGPRQDLPCSRRPLGGVRSAWHSKRAHSHASHSEAATDSAAVLLLPRRFRGC
jgi:hypothetical protein